MTEFRKRAASIGRIAGWNIGILLAGLIALELIFGNWLFGQKLGLLLVPRNVDIEHVLDHVPGKPTARYTRDAFGLRGAYGAPSDIDVLVVGGSTTNELLVGDGDTFVDVLRRQLAAAGVSKVVVNAGVDGHSTVGHLRAFDVWFPRIPGLAPDWVVFYVGINDVAVAAQALYDDTITETRGPLKRFSRRFKNDSVLYQLFRILRGAVQARDVRLVHGADVAARDFPVALTAADRIAASAAAEKPDGLPQYRDRLRALVAAVEAWGAKPVFVTQRRGDVRIDGTTLRGATRAAISAQIELDHVNAVTLSVCAATAARCIDLGREIRFRNGDFYDPVHTTPQGARRVGTYLAEKLAPVFRGE